MTTKSSPLGRRAHARLGALVATTALGLACVFPASAAPRYTVTKVLVAQDEWKGETNLVPAPIYKPHDARTTSARNFWVTSNERTGCAGITVLQDGTDKVLAKVNIDEPGVTWHGGAEETGNGPPCVGTLQITESDANFAPSVRMNPKVCLPVVLPPGASIPVWQGVAAKKGPYPNTICAPLGAESHPRHPHSLIYDNARKRLYQVIEHAGLRWNSSRTAFQVAENTDEESGLTLAWDLSDPYHPKMLKAYLNGHGAHEIVVNQRNGLVYQGNHEQSPGVHLTPQSVAPDYGGIWVDVIDTTKDNPYGFIDTGYFNAVQGIDYAPGATAAQDVIFGVTHVGEKMFAFDAACVSQPNDGSAVPPPAPPGYSLPAGDTGMKMGWNCIKYWVDLRPAFLSQLAKGQDYLNYANAPASPNVLHFHNLQVNPVTHRAYMAVHSIHNAEHTGLDHSTTSEEEQEELEHEGHIMGRWLHAVGAPTAIDPSTKKASAPVRIIDMSHGYDALIWPTAHDIQTRLGVTKLLNSFVHGHFHWVDATRSTLLVSGEHTGNLGVIDETTDTLVQVLPISKVIPGCSGFAGLPADAEEPHLHGVVIHPETGTVYLSDEGEHCWYESVTILKPSN